MTYHIIRIVNDSPWAVVLTNPVTDRDTHIVPASYGDPAIAGRLVPANPPKIETIKDNTIAYPAALKRALNIYTFKNNWCFWDNGVEGVNTLIGAGENDAKILLNLPPKVTDLELAVSPEGVPSFRTPSPDQCTLDLTIQRQVRLAWCWAATAASISNYYEKTQDWTPCKVACKVLGRTDCCEFFAGAGCDQRLDFAEALQAMGHWRASSGGLSFLGVQEEIDFGHPILVALEGDFGGHGVVITGYNNFNPKKPTIEVQDPQDGSKTAYDFANFPSNHGSYKWKATCKTQ
jgi:Papain-like cysteine protease AvrRpt2